MHLSTSNSAAAAEPAALSLAPLDIPLIVELGRALDARAVAAACRGWLGTPSGKSPPLKLRVDCAPDFAGTGPARISMAGPVMEIAGPGVRASADPHRRLASCLVSGDYLADPQRLRGDVLEPLMLTLVTAQDRAPLHASGFIAGDLAIILAGRSGSGKSCLARAADTAGFQLLSDDVVYVQRSPHLRVWGWPGAVHLLAHDTTEADWPTRIRNGKTKYAVRLRSASASAIGCDSAVLCVLARGETVALRPIESAEALRRLWPLDPGFDLLPEAIGAAVAAIAARGAWELRLSGEPDEALRLLTASLPLLRKTAAR
jgi:hypothetical protein